MSMHKKKYLIVGLSSFPGGGKDFIADILIDKYDFYKVSPGDITREALKRAGRGHTLTREMQEEISKRMIRKHGQNYIMELCYRQILKSKKPRIVIPGIRYPSDFEFYKEKFDDSFINIFVSASRKTRYDRIIFRKREAKISYAKFIKEDAEQEHRYHLQQTKELSDYKINNDKSNLRSLKKTLSSIIERHI